MISLDSERTKDALLLLQLEQGSKQAFSALYEKYWEKSFSSAYKRLKDKDQAKDIVQDIFENIWLRRNEIHIDNFPAYLNIAVRNRVLKLVEKQKILCPFFDLLEDLPTRYQRADNDIVWQELYAAYENLLNNLPPKRQIIFRLRFQNDLSPNAIANKLEISRKTVHNQLGKAIEQVRIALLHLFVLLILLFQLS